MIFALLLAAAPFSADALADEKSHLISEMDEDLFRSANEKAIVRTTEGKFGSAVEFSFAEGGQSAFCTSSLRGDGRWDGADGFSFWLKGDGSENLGGLQFIFDDDYAVRYDFAFPLDDQEWKKIVVRWEDLVPVLPGERSRPLSKQGPNRPSKLSALWIGKWWYWRDYPAVTFAIDRVQLEPSIPYEEPSRPEGPALARIAAKLKRGEPIKIVTMGDSLTDVRHWANRDTNWPQLLAERLEKEFGSEVAVVNPAIGGTQLRQNLVLIPGWSQEAPDLVTICFGFNDWDAGMRGEQFRQTYVDAVRRVREATGGKADVLILTTAPAATRWTEMAELSQACRDAAKEANAGLVDLERTFHDAGREDRERLYVHDKTHLSPAGHALVAEAILAELRRAADEPSR
ncbi:MAG TPA: GDSL-type esterase/lipase family protein [Pirellulaceae bacterium]|jgi:lysophospholipase L1-like esterase|nr:GDSL-type esterase/lipase family protein [Pirellulaceae bacterium]